MGKLPQVRARVAIAKRSARRNWALPRSPRSTWACKVIARARYFSGTRKLAKPRAGRRQLGRQAGSNAASEQGKPNQIIGWQGGEAGSLLTPEPYQKLGGPWIDGERPGGWHRQPLIGWLGC